MKKADRGMPNMVFIGPPKKRACFKLVVFHILEKDGNNIPTKTRMLLDDDEVTLAGGEEFMTAYVLKEMTEPH
jgi:hypothetical protein